MSAAYRTTGSALLWMLLRRLFQAAALALAVGGICFLMAQALPGDMATRIAAGRYGYDLVSNAAADAIRSELGLNQPAWQALLQWWTDLARLRLGDSLLSAEPVWNEVQHQLGATLQLAAAAVLLATLWGLPLGIWTGLHPHGKLDRLTLVLAVVLRATPSFLLAVLLMLLVAVQWVALPVAGDVHAGAWALPALTLSLPLGAGLARVTRSAMREVMLSASYEFARTKGLSDFQVLWRHGLRQAALPLVAYLGVHAVFLVEGAVVVETVFAWPGIGHALVHAVFGRDVPMIQGTALCLCFLFVGFNLLVDAACLAIDPRRRAGALA